MNNGWVKISRDIINWEWFDTPGMVQLFIYLLVKANYTDKEWHDMVIRRGQIVTSVAKISADTGLSTQVVRTCLNRLKLTNTITIKTTNKYTIVTINRYDDYQSYDVCDIGADNNQNNKQITNEQQTNNNQLTTTKEYKEREKDNNNTHTEYLLEFLSRTRANTPDSVQRMAEAAQEIRRRAGENTADKSRYDALTSVGRGFIIMWAKYPRLMSIFEESLSYGDFCYMNERYEVSDIENVVGAMADKLPFEKKRLGSFLETFKRWAVSDFQIAEKKRLGNPKYAQNGNCRRAHI